MITGVVQYPRPNMAQMTDREIYIVNAPEVARALGQSDTMSGFKLREHNPDEFPEQDPMRWRVKGLRMPIENTDFMADEITEGGYVRIFGNLIRNPKVQAIAEEVNVHMLGDDEENKGGGSVLVVTPHGEVTDVAFALKILSDLLEAKGNRPDLAIIISKMVPEYDYVSQDGPISAVGVLQLLCSDIFMNWPVKESSKSHLTRLPTSERRRHNNSLREELLRYMRLGEKIVAMAPAGTTQIGKKSSGQSELAEFSDGTIELMMDPKTRVLPMVANILREKAAGRDPIVTLPSGLIKIESRADAEDLREYLGSLHTEGSRN